MDTITPSDWVVAPDGSGDYRSLSEAVEKAEAGATLRLKAGVHRLNRPLEINKELSLIGEGMETTRIACAEAGTVVRYTGEGTFSASDLTFVHEGLNWGGAFSADRGEVFLQRCRFTGGIRDKTNSRGGDGLWLHGNVRGQVISCHAVENELIGIRVSEQAQPILEGNTCQGNKDTGIAYFGTAAGVARRNTCTGNESRGIYVGGQAQPTLEGNTCQGNKQSGISYFGTAAGVARQNTCTGNENRGISVGEQAQPTLEGNTCQGNKWSGIAYFGTAAGVARQNTCTGNEQYGIYVGEQAQPTLEGNTCQENKWSGIAYFGTAAGVARRNTCTGNEKNGIYVASTASPSRRQPLLE
ncbi:MAG: right-handed parallel beta-helix repeat-containing protein [Anaerolineae bacterium]|nr:MAG: right-handed parallel beta-helix repeat-containing protein [Anaerolineae bacterium]